jgi:hypothetical protein
LGHDQLNILVLKTLGINFLSVILVVILLSILNCLALAVVVVVVVVVTGVIVSSVVMSSVVVGVSSSQLLGCGSLSLGVKVLNLSLTEDTVEDRLATIEAP